MIQKTDIFCHWLPTPYYAAVRKRGPVPEMLARAYSIPVMSGLEKRFGLMDGFPGYCQIPSLVSPPFEQFADDRMSAELARIANDASAVIAQAHPDRFSGFVASVPMRPDAMPAEAERAVKELGACGVQIFTQHKGQPIDGPDYDPFFHLMAEMDKPVWLHPARGIEHADYRSERYSRLEIWWSIGWLYETTAAMIRLAFSGIFERLPGLKIIAHHAGAFVPAAEGRLGAGMEAMGCRTPDNLQSLNAHRSGLPLVDNLKKFYTDSATFGSETAFESGLDFFGIDHMLFASDMPFGPDQGKHHIETACSIIDAHVKEPSRRAKIYSGNILGLTGMNGGTD